MLSRWGRVGLVNRSVVQRRTFAGTVVNENPNPWTESGGCAKHLAAELDLGMYEEGVISEKSGLGIWSGALVQRNAIALGTSIEQYSASTLASKERIVLWEYFRIDIERAIRDTLKDDSVKVLMMGGVAQGMATFDGDVDLIVVLPNHLSQLRDRSRVRNIFHNICRGLKRNGFDGFVIPARVPIIQYRPNTSLGKLFENGGADNVFRYLKIIDGSPAEELCSSISDTLSRSVRIINVSGVGKVLEFELAANAFSAMFRFPRKLELLHFQPKKRSAEDSAARILELRKKLGDRSIKEGEENIKISPPLPPQDTDGSVTIDDILRIAAKGRSGGLTGAYVPYPFAVDLSIAVNEAPWGPRNSELLRRYCSDSRVRNLAMFVKWWSKHSLPVQINASRSGWLTSYCVLVMFVHFMIRTEKLTFIDPESIEPILSAETVYPDVNEMTDTDKIEIVRDFYNFCWFYATEFDPATEVVTILTPNRKQRSECTAKVMSARNVAIIIEDPYEDRSLGHNINADQLVSIRASFLAAARSLRESLTGTAERSILLGVLRERGRGIFDKYFPEFPSGTSNDTTCKICRHNAKRPNGQHAAKHLNGLCKPCADAFESSSLALSFFAKRTGSSRMVTEQVHITEQRRQERSLRDQQFLERNNKGDRVYQSHSV